ncbi:phosphinothricin acetyltransferase [Paraoerskovia marina]|uniref:Phosphinothricin acetyltransferase n=1 Tax=Paraoerskovia marina TaxID=545619 RepID=A0A1H1PBP2_9CELL|nr:phosphinothricin acetyltransferase [Paraoerskovia marina]
MLRWAIPRTGRVFWHTRGVNDGEDTAHHTDAEAAGAALGTVDHAVRDATDDDAAGIGAVYEYYVRESTATFETDPPDVEFWRERMHSTQSEGWPFVVAEGPDGTILGWAYVGWWRPRPAYRYTVETSIYLLPGQAGKGLGSALLQRVLDGSRAAGAREAVAIISSGASPASRKLHEKLGFHEIGRLTDVGYKHGQWLDTAIMQMHLGPGPEEP